MRSVKTSHRILIALAATAAATLALAGCAGEPSPLTKALAGGAHAPQAATISAIEPASGSVSGGTATITGGNLTAVSTVKIGDQEAVVTEKAADKLVVSIPAARNFQEGPAAISATDASGKALAAEGASFDYRVVTPVDRQLSYAMAHWQDYNTKEWGDLNPVGGDCANFVSQTLIQRGWEMDGKWYNRDAAGDWSPAWGYVPAMDVYLSDNAKRLGLTRHTFDERDKIRIGDIVMFDWNDNDSLDHVQIVSGIRHENGQIKILMVGHNEDTDYRDLDTTITVDHPGAIGHFWSLSD